MSNVQTVEGLNPRAQTGIASLAPRIVLVVATVAAGLHAGFFWAYQVSIIPAFKDVDDTTYVTSFQEINEKVQNPVFFSVFLGAPVLIGAALAFYRRSARPFVTLVGAALVLNLVAFAITAAGNVPLNNELADHKTITPEIAATARSDFEDTWNWLNLARTIASVASLACLIAAMVVALGSTGNSDRTTVGPGHGE